MIGFELRPVGWVTKFGYRKEIPSVFHAEAKIKPFKI
jgi:hypothetical protein